MPLCTRSIAVALAPLDRSKATLFPQQGGKCGFQLVRARIDGVAANAVDLLPDNEPSLGFSIRSAIWAFDYKF